MITENDPNVRWGKKTFTLTFMCWAYHVTATTTVGGNCLGFDNLDSALMNVYDQLPVNEYDVTYIVLFDEKGDTLQCEDEEYRCDDWLKNMLVSAVITHIEPEERK